MTTKALRHTRCRRRQSGTVIDRAWLIALVLRTLASLVVVVVTRLLGETSCGGR